MGEDTEKITGAATGKPLKFDAERGEVTYAHEARYDVERGGETASHLEQGVTKLSGLKPDEVRFLERRHGG